MAETNNEYTLWIGNNGTYSGTSYPTLEECFDNARYFEPFGELKPYIEQDEEIVVSKKNFQKMYDEYFSKKNVESNILSSKEEQFEMPYAGDVNHLIDNIDNFILKQYPSRDMAKRQTIEYLFEKGKLQDEYLAHFGLKSKEDFDKFIPRRQSELRAGVNKERKDSIEKLQEFKTETFLENIRKVAEEADDKMLAAIEENNKEGSLNEVPTTESEKDELILQSLPVQEVDESGWFLNDGWFASHPDKVLGIPYESSGRYGKVTKYKGTIEDIDRIDVIVPTLSKTLDNSPLQSGESESFVQSTSITNPENQTFILDEIDESNKNVGKKFANKKEKSANVEDNSLVFNEPELQTFEDVWRTYNKGISKEELEVYIWHKTQIGRPLSRRWINLVHNKLYDEDLTRPERYNVDEEDINEWVKKGLLYYYEGKLVPAVEYLSGDMYDKKHQLDRDREDILEKYGEDVYNNQSVSLNNLWKGVYDNRLTIGQTDESLVVLPISRLATEFKINRLSSFAEGIDGFKVKLFTTQKDLGRPNWDKDITLDDYKRDDVPSLSLIDAFNYYLLRNRPALTLPIDYMQIVKYYCLGKNIMIKAKSDDKADIKKAEAEKENLKTNTQFEGQRLFKIFLDTELDPNDKIRLETQWNSDYNNYKPIDLNKIPVAFNMCRNYKGKFEELKPEKREAVAFMMHTGSGILSYGVGLGKTPSAIFSMSSYIDAGYAKRLALVVPNQVYKQFISEIKAFAPHIPILEGYNLSPDYIAHFQGVDGNIINVPEGSITVFTYEGLESIGFNDETQRGLLTGLYDILNQGGEDEKALITKVKSDKQKAGLMERLETLVGRGLSGTMCNIEDLGFDFICYDEAHAMKKVFTSVKGEQEENSDGTVSKKSNPYKINSGTPSTRALKGFMLNYYIQRNNYGGNIMMLTATPFTNSPLEIFSMLSMVAYEKLKDTNLNNIKTFFDNYVDATNRLTVNSRNNPEFKQVILGFNNLVSLQSLIRRFINYKTGEEVGINRPKKYVLPYVSESIDNIVTRLSENDKIDTFITMTPLQESLMNQITAYAEGDMDISDMANEMEEILGDVDESEEVKGKSVEVDESSLSEDEKVGVRRLKAINYSRNLALSPHLYEHSGLTKKPDYKSYIEMSPKLKYIVESIRSVKLYHESKNEPISGQVIYMDRGVVFFPLIKEYLVKEIGYKEHEIGIIQSGLPPKGKKSKEYVKNLFNGEIYNEVTKMFDLIPDEDRIKVIIGSSTIKEGINLQRFGTVLYDAFIDWNPTDMEQLCGRIYRQGNNYGAVRIVIPLVVDSIDAFLFQKLGEKTSRLSTIWSNDGKKNVMKLDDLNPEELKYALIKKPEKIAKLKSLEEKMELDRVIMGYKNQMDRADILKKNVSTIKSYYDWMLRDIKPYRDIQIGDDKIMNAAAICKAMIDTERTQKDKDGKKMVDYEERRRPYQNYGETSDAFAKRLEKWQGYSDLSPFQKPSRFADFAVAVRDTNRMIHNFVNQNNIYFSLDDLSGLDAFKERMKSEIDKTTEKQNYLSSSSYMDILVNEIISERELNKIEYKPLAEAVKDFEKLNYLLSEKSSSDNKKKVQYTSCPPVDDKGVRLIDDSALAYLTECIEREGQTKDLYFNEDTKTYEIERQAFHDKIIKDIFTGVKCVSQVKPIAVFTGGSPASGKSHFIKEVADYLTNESIFHLDADEIRAKLPEYKGWNASATHKETQDIVNSILNNIGEGKCRYDFIYDGTMNKAEKYYPLIKKVNELGYDTYIIFMDIPYGVARSRALARYQKSGRYVPIEVIDDFFAPRPNSGGKTMGQYALDELKPLVKGYIVVDGITGDIIEKGGEDFPHERLYDSKPLLDIEAPIIEKIDEPIIEATVSDAVESVEELDNEEIIEEEQPKVTKENIEKAIKGLEVLAKFGDENAKKAIKGLKVLLMTFKEGGILLNGKPIKAGDIIFFNGNKLIVDYVMSYIDGSIEGIFALRIPDRMQFNLKGKDLMKINFGNNDIDNNLKYKIKFDVKYEKLVDGEYEPDIKTFTKESEAKKFAKENYSTVEKRLDEAFKEGGEIEGGYSGNSDKAIPVKAGSVIITRGAIVDDNTKHEYEGEMLNNREVLSRINKEGGGVAFGKGGEVKKKSF